MVVIPPLNIIKENNFHRAWYKAVNYILHHGVELKLGSREKQEIILDSTICIELTGSAVRQIINRELHPDFPFKQVEEYCKTFTYEYLEQYLNQDDDSRFKYIYMDRLANYPATFSSNKFIHEESINQLSLMRLFLYHQIKENFTSNRCQAISWIPYIDSDSKAAPCKINPPDSPCLQRIQLRHIGDGNIDVHISFRSHDCYRAWQVNLIAIVTMLNRYVLDSSRYKLIRIVEFNDSLHIYNRDKSDAKRVKPIPDYI